MAVSSFDENLRYLVADMKETMRAEHGVGLAAPQIGHPVQVFVVEWQHIDLVVVNPVVELSGPMISAAEGCLSLPDAGYVVKRHQRATIKAFDAEGRQYRAQFDDFAARIIQHELDHLFGILIADRGMRVL